jgi:hypothetical protein
MVKVSLSTDFVKLWVENGLKSKNVVIQLGSFSENAYLCRPKNRNKIFYNG